LWMLDTDYDGMCVNPRQVFFSMDGASGGWNRLAKTLKAEINQDLIEKYQGIESLPFAVKDNSYIAVKIVDDRGIESLKIIPVTEEKKYMRRIDSKIYEQAKKERNKSCAIPLTQ